MASCDSALRTGLRFSWSPSATSFPRAAKVTERDWDANWLRVRGTVTPDDRRGWSFTDACLTTFEARELADWLRGVIIGEVQPRPFEAGKMEGLLWFTEPCLAFSLASLSAEDVVIRVHLSLEALPGRLSAMRPELYAHYVEVQMSLPELAVAAEDWCRELSVYPVR